MRRANPLGLALLDLKFKTGFLLRNPVFCWVQQAPREIESNRIIIPVLWAQVDFPESLQKKPGFEEKTRFYPIVTWFCWCIT
jgi:hypothetical protein